MSVSISFVRFVETQQVFLLSMQCSEHAWQDLRAEPLDYPQFVRNYCFIEIGSSGWVGGSHRRVKRVSPEKALPYLNKLVEGGWITVDEYSRAYGVTQNLLIKMRGRVSDESLRNWLADFC